MTIVYFDGDEVPSDQKDPKNTSILKQARKKTQGNTVQPFSPQALQR